MAVRTTTLLFLSFVLAHADDQIRELPIGSNVSEFDPSRVIMPFLGINFTGCYMDLVQSDSNGDGVIKKGEYLPFIQRYAERKCIVWQNLTLRQNAAFNSLACQCRRRASNQRLDCCLGGNAQLNTSGALNEDRTEEEFLFLANVCTVTDGTIGPTQCPIIILPRDEPPDISIVPPLEGRVGGVDTGVRGALIPAIIGGLLLFLLCCCCCCVLRQRRTREIEEEEIVENYYPGKNQQIPEQAAPPAASRDLDFLAEPQSDGPQKYYEPEPDPEEFEEEVFNIGAEQEEDDDYGEGRQARGGNYIEEEEDDEQRRWGGKQLPPAEAPEPESVVLRSIPAKEQPETDEWDQPGREIEEYKPEPDEMSAQQFDPYAPDGGVNIPQRESKESTNWRNQWERPQKPEEDEVDYRKHRIQAGLGKGEVWDKLDDDDDSKSKSFRKNNTFDWVVQTAIGALDQTDAQGYLDDSSAAPSSQGPEFT